MIKIVFVIRLRYTTLKIVFFSNRVISVISVVLRESNLTISDSTGEPVSLESEKSASGFP